MRLRLAGILAAVGLALAGETLDQIAVTVDDQVITTSDIVNEIRVTALLNGEQPDFSAANRRQTADRLVEQILVHREMELTRYPQPHASEVKDELQGLKRRFGGEEAFRKELGARKTTEQQVQEALLRQAALLRFIDLRFRPEVQVQESDVMQYCEGVYLPQLRKPGVTPSPSFEDVRPQCEEALVGQLVDKRVDAWLKEARTRSRITYEEEAFR